MTLKKRYIINKHSNIFICVLKFINLYFFKVKNCLQLYIFSGKANNPINQENKENPSENQTADSNPECDIEGILF